MLELIQRLIDALREELEQYGELLALLDQQQEAALTRSSDEVLNTIAAVNAQSAVIQVARQHRDQCRLHLACALAQSDSTSLTVLLPLLPENYQPLVQALVQENNDLLHRVQQRARQNHLMLSRALELMQTLINTMAPSGPTPVPLGNGTVPKPSMSSRPLYEAAG
jgi:flagellar biosynthesis/type III secretory pathway chaperone